MVNAGEPGTFQSTLSQSLALNGLKDMKLPPNPPSAAILRTIMAPTASPVQQQPQQLREEREEVRRHLVEETPQPQQQQKKQTQQQTQQQQSTPTEAAETSSKTAGDGNRDEGSPTQPNAEATDVETPAINIYIAKKTGDSWPKVRSGRTLKKGHPGGQIQGPP